MDKLLGEDQKLRNIFRKTTNGLTVGRYGRLNYFAMSFGCKACAWRDTPMCPHGLKYNQHHANGICSQRVLYVKDTYNIVHSKARFMQVEHAAELKLTVEKMLHDYHEGDLLDKQYSLLSRNLITVLDKMRRQDEGLKIQQDISIDVSDFRKVVDAQARAIDGKSILEVEDANKSDNGEGYEESGEEV